VSLFVVDARCCLYRQTHHFNSATLVLYENKLKSTIPSEVGHLTELREYDCVMWLYANMSQKVLSHAKAAFLVIVGTLSIFLNELTGKIPSEIGQLLEMGKLY
jgi:predicted RNase H-like nuclease